jgi:hypothetical protein
MRWRLLRLLYGAALANTAAATELAQSTAAANLTLI